MKQQMTIKYFHFSMNYNLIFRFRGCHTPNSSFWVLIQMELILLLGMFCPTLTDVMLFLH